MWRVMLRRLLACLALLTGLSAAGAPVQAHMAEAEVAHIEAGLTIAPSEPAKLAKAAHVSEAAECANVPACWPAALASTSFARSVQLRIDRARE